MSVPWRISLSASSCSGVADIRLKAQLVCGPQPVPSTLTTPAEKATYAAGLFTMTYGGSPVIDHSGEWEGFTANLLVAPTDHVALTLTCNGATIDPYGIGFEVLDAWLGR